MFLKPKIERDPNIQKLEQNIFAKIQEVIKSEPLQQGQATPDIQFISFEEAIKELAQTNK